MIRILIVEDEITIARLIDLNLSACGYDAPANMTAWRPQTFWSR